MRCAVVLCTLPIVCNADATIAKEIDLNDPEENLEVQMLRQAAEKTGDGTSTAVRPRADRVQVATIPADNDLLLSQGMSMARRSPR